MLWCFLIGSEKGGMEYRVDLLSGGNLEVESCTRDDFLYLEWASSLHLELLEPVHVEVGCLKPYFVSNFPRDELGGYPLFHLLLGHFVGGLGIVSGSG